MLAKMPDGCVDMVFADPPYGIGYTSWYRRRELGGKIFENESQVDTTLVGPIISKLKTGTAIYICTRWDVAGKWMDSICVHAKVKNAIFVNKGAIGMGDLAGNYGNSVTIVVYATKGRHLLRGKRMGNCWDIPQVYFKEHPSPKPITLMSRCIEKSTDENQIVFDPYMGSGSTGVSCIETGRRFIGCELDKECFEFACERISKAYNDKRGDC